MGKIDDLTSKVSWYMMYCETFFRLYEKVCNEISFRESYVYKSRKEESECRSLKNFTKRIIRRFTSTY